LSALYQAREAQTTCRECNGGDEIKTLRRNTVLEVHAHLSKCWRGTWPEKVWEPLA